VIDQDRPDRTWLTLLLGERRGELLLVDQRALEQLAAEDGVGGDAGGIAGLGDAIRLTPASAGTDGFFVAVMRRAA